MHARLPHHPLGSQGRQSSVSRRLPGQRLECVTSRFLLQQHLFPSNLCHVGARRLIHLRRHDSLMPHLMLKCRPAMLRHRLFATSCYAVTSWSSSPAEGRHEQVSHNTPAGNSNANFRCERSNGGAPARGAVKNQFILLKRLVCMQISPVNPTAIS